jgi:alkanesulfonate monooxygenase SsuD/methylene tetrahydromethanopterin reductase-like flavin-dependent oxidoreductase (luciferase family)
MQLGIYSFGDRARTLDGTTSSAQAQRNLLEAIQLADEVGLDYFGIGEHHTEESRDRHRRTAMSAGHEGSASPAASSSTCPLPFILLGAGRGSARWIRW